MLVIIKRSIAALGALGLLVLAGCSAGGSVAEKDLAAYACGLAGQLEGPAESWAEGESAGNSMLKFASAQSIIYLTGVAVSTELEEFQDISVAAGILGSGLSSMDTEKLDAGASQLRAVCAGHDLPVDDVDVSRKGRVDFGCRAAADVKANDIDLEAWLKSDDDSRTDFFKLMSAGNLLGDSVVKDEMAPELREAASELFDGIKNLDSQTAESGLEAVQKHCEAR